MTQVNTRIADSDSDSSVIDRLELNRKIDRANSYIHKVKQRLTVLEKQRLRIIQPDSLEDVSRQFDQIIDQPVSRTYVQPATEGAPP